MSLPFLSQINPAAKDPQSGAIKTWSFSTLEKFNVCPYSQYLAKVRRIKSKQSAAAERGEDLHGIIEDYIQGKTDKLPKTKIKHCHQTIDFYRDKYAQEAENVVIEDNWGVTTDWRPTEWMAKDVWGRIKLDAFYRESPNSARIDDWKSGKKYGNEAKHIKQLQVYAIGAFAYYPELEFIEASMRYIDIASDNKLTRGFTRTQADQLKPVWHNKAIAMTTATEFRPNPNRHNCRFCPFAKPLNEDLETDCEYAVVGD